MTRDNHYLPQPTKADAEVAQNQDPDNPLVWSPEQGCLIPKIPKSTNGALVVAPEQAVAVQLQNPVVHHNGSDFRVETTVLSPDELEVSWEKPGRELSIYETLGFRKENTGFSGNVWDLSSNGLCVICSTSASETLTDRVSPGAQLFYTFLFRRSRHRIEKLIYADSFQLRGYVRFSVMMPRPLDEWIETTQKTSSYYEEQAKLLEQIESIQVRSHKDNNKKPRKPVEERLVEEMARWEEQQKRLRKLGVSERDEEWQLMQNRYESNVQNMFDMGG